MILKLRPIKEDLKQQPYICCVYRRNLAYTYTTLLLGLHTYKKFQ